MVKIVPHEALLRPQFTSRQIEGWLWNLNFEFSVKISRPKLSDLTGTHNTHVRSFWHYSHIYSTNSQAICKRIISWYTFNPNFLFYHFCAIYTTHFIPTFDKLYESSNSSLQNFPAFTLIYSIISPNITVLSYILNVINLKPFSTSFYNLYSLFVDEDLKCF